MEALCIRLDSREPDGPQALQPTVTARQLQCAQNTIIQRQEFWWLLMTKFLYGVQIVGLVESHFLEDDFPGRILRWYCNCAVALSVYVLLGLCPDCSSIMWLAAAVRGTASILDACTDVFRKQCGVRPPRQSLPRTRFGRSSGLRPGIQDIAHFAKQRLSRERLLEERHSLLQHAMAQHGVIRVA